LKSTADRGHLSIAIDLRSRTSSYCRLPQIADISESPSTSDRGHHRTTVYRRSRTSQYYVGRVILLTYLRQPQIEDVIVLPYTADRGHFSITWGVRCPLLTYLLTYLLMPQIEDVVMPPSTVSTLEMIRHGCDHTSTKRLECCAVWVHTICVTILRPFHWSVVVPEEHLIRRLALQDHVYSIDALVKLANCAVRHFQVVIAMQQLEDEDLLHLLFFQQHGGKLIELRHHL